MILNIINKLQNERTFIRDYTLKLDTPIDLANFNFAHSLL